MNISGDKLRAIRHKKKLSQWDLALLADVTQGEISHLETGARKRPSFDTVTKISNALKIEPTDLIENGV